MSRASRVELPEELVAEFLRRVGEGETQLVEQLLREEPRLANAVGPHPFWGGRPQPLHVAIEMKRDALVKRLLDAGANVDGDNDAYLHWSPLLIAIHGKHQKAKRMLLARGARVGLVEALALGDDKIVLRMLKRGKRALPKQAPNGGSLLAFARTPKAIDRLLALGVSTTTRDRWGADPMEAFSRQRKVGKALVHHLASHGVPVGAEHLARLGDRRALAKLVAADAQVPTQPAVMKAAVDFGHRALVTWLADRGADLNARSTSEANETCLHSAAWNGDLAMVELLLARGANPLLRDRQHDGTPAGWAEVAVTVTSNADCKRVAERLRSAEASYR